MCGIVGAAGAVSFNEVKMVKMMTMLDTIRGPHSTGFYGFDPQGNGDIFKALGTPWDAMQHKGWDNFFAGTFNVLIGHNRWATEGGINTVNAHPFRHGSIAGVHNGTIKNWRNKLKDAKYFNVDSDCLYHNIDNDGIDKALDKLTFQDAYALVYFNEADNTLNMVRNDERTLYYAYSKDRKTLFWASEAWMITVAAGKNGVKIGDVTLLPIEKLMTVHIPPKGNYQRDTIQDVTLRDIEFTPIVTKVKEKVVAITHNSGKKKAVDNADDIAKVRSHLKQYVEFRVNGQRQDETLALDFYDCYLDSDPDVKIRYYPQDQSFKSKFAERCLSEDILLRAIVISCQTRLGETYGVVNPLTMTEVQEPQLVKK